MSAMGMGWHVIRRWLTTLGCIALLCGNALAQRSASGSRKPRASPSGSPSASPNAKASGPLVPIEHYPGADIAAQIAAAQAAWGSSPATFTVNIAGTASTAFTMASGHDLQFRAPVTLNATAVLAGKNRVLCEPSAMLTTARIAFHATGETIEIAGCSATGTNNHATLLETVSASNVKVHDNKLFALQAASITGGTHIDVYNNTIAPSASAGKTVYATTVAGDASYVSFYGNNVTGASGSCWQYFNADADPNHGPGAPKSRADVLAHGGHYRVENNTCKNAGAGFWGSVGHDVVMNGNHCESIGDTCYDYEGSADVVASNNTCDANTTGGGLGTCGSIFFFSDNVTFTHNRFYSSIGANLFFLKNSSQAPVFSSNLHLIGNTFTCYKVQCAAYNGDPSTGLIFRDNVLQDAIVTNTSFSTGFDISANTLQFNLKAASAMCAIATPNLQSGSGMVTSNIIRSVAAQPPGSKGICASIHANNANVSVAVRGNSITGGFTTGIDTVNAGTNVGTGTTFTLSGNTMSAGITPATHAHPGTNHDLYDRRD
jgi:hypothetical protein